MSRISFIRLSALLAVIALVIGGTILYAEEGEEEVNKYFGKNAKVCKMCHKDQVLAWEKWPMSGSWDRLSDEEKLKEECIACHVTGYGEPGGFVSEKETPTLVGITCEACHGPASAHMKASAKDIEARIATMSEPDEANCLKCHIEEGNPNFKEFDYKKEVEALADHFPVVEEVEETE